jgi:hypothetical protein
MQFVWFRTSGFALVAVLALPLTASLEAAENGGVAPAAGALDKRTKLPVEPEGQAGGISDSAVRVLMTYAVSIIPDEVRGPDGKPVKVNKSDVNKFFIPTEDARRVIRVATRSAYAEVCQLLDLQQANYQTFMKGEEARKVWSHDQLLLINALHMFSVSYFLGNLKITMTEVDENAPAGTTGGATAVAKGAAPQQAAGQNAEDSEVVAAPRPQCPPEQKQKVMNAINAYVQAAKAAPAPAPKAGE